MNRREFLIVGASAPVVLSLGADGCSSADVEATIATILKDLPTAIQIAESIIAIIGAAKGGQPSATALAQLSNWSGQIQSDLQLAGTLISQYETNLSAAPPSVLGQIDAAIASVNGNISAIENAIHVYDPTTQAAVAVAVASIDTIVLGLEALVPPASVPQFPQTAAALRNRHKTLGAMGKVTVPSARTLAKEYRAKVQKDFPAAAAGVEVPPLIHIGGLRI